MPPADRSTLYVPLMVDLFTCDEPRQRPMPDGPRLCTYKCIVRCPFRPPPPSHLPPTSHHHTTPPNARAGEVEMRRGLRHLATLHGPALVGQTAVFSHLVPDCCQRLHTGGSAAVCCRCLHAKVHGHRARQRDAAPFPPSASLRLPSLMRRRLTAPQAPCHAPMHRSAVRAVTNCTLWEFRGTQVAKLVRHSPELLPPLCENYLQARRGRGRAGHRGGVVARARARLPACYASLLPHLINRHAGVTSSVQFSPCSPGMAGSSCLPLPPPRASHRPPRSSLCRSFKARCAAAWRRAGSKCPTQCGASRRRCGS